MRDVNDAFSQRAAILERAAPRTQAGVRVPSVFGVSAYTVAFRHNRKANLRRDRRGNDKGYGKECRFHRLLPLNQMPNASKLLLKVSNFVLVKSAIDPA